MVFGVATGAAQTPIIASDNIELVGTFPETVAISAEFARTDEFFYTSSVDNVSVYDYSANPHQPMLVGTMPTVNFENESMTYGERIVNGELKRFVLLASDQFAAGIDHVHALGGEIFIVDVTDPTDPHVISSVVADTSIHTVQCVDQADCEYAYTAGDHGKFSIIHFPDLENPVHLKNVPSSAAHPNPVFSPGAGHYWDFDNAGIGWHTGSGGAVAFDVSDPANPVPVQAGNQISIERPYNDFIFHNSMRPNADRFQPGQPPSADDGNVLLVTEEDYFFEGDELECEHAGSFQTWHIPDMDGDAYRAGNPGEAEPGKGTIAPLDIVNAPFDFGGGLSTPVGAFCSAHWFDYHQDGYVIQAYYQQGVRLLDVRDPRNIEQVGFFTPLATEVWDAYWVPERDANGVVTGRKTNLVYTADFVRGVDVLEVTLDPAAQPTAPPTQPTGSPSPTTSGSPSATPTTTAPSSPTPSGSVQPTGGTTGDGPPLAETGAAPLALAGALGVFALIAALRRTR